MSDFRTRLRSKFLLRRTTSHIEESSTPSPTGSPTTGSRRSSLPVGLRTASSPHVASAFQKKKKNSVSSQGSGSVAGVSEREQGVSVNSSGGSGGGGRRMGGGGSDRRRPPSPSPSTPLRRATDDIASGQLHDHGHHDNARKAYAGSCGEGGGYNNNRALPTPLSHESDPDSPDLPKLILEYPTPPHEGGPPAGTAAAARAGASLSGTLLHELISVESPPELDRHTELPPSSRFVTHREEREEVGRWQQQQLSSMPAGDGAQNRIKLHPSLQGDLPVQAQSETVPCAKAPAVVPAAAAAAAASAPTSNMSVRKVWVKRPGASATLVQVRGDDLVDDVRDMILRKYGNSLGRSFDAPDIVLKLVTRSDGSHKQAERILAPEEEMHRLLDQAYPGGQTVNEALIVDAPQRRTPKPSPRASYQQYNSHPDDTGRPHEEAGGYFPPMPAAVPSPAAIAGHPHHSNNVTNASNQEHIRAMSVLHTGQVPPLPSPGNTRRSHHNRAGRPPHVRQHTSSPTTMTAMSSTPGPLKTSRPRHDSTASDRHHHPGALNPNVPAALATPPIQPHDPNISAGGAVQPPAGLVNPGPSTPRVSSPGPGRERRMKKQKSRQANLPSKDQPAPSSVPNGLGLDTSVPPINVLIVEDNHINLKLLEQFIRRLKVRWATAVNGREAVNKWRAGGFHLVLMDIQLPIMSGLEATKEIRRLERVNNIGVFSGGGASSSASAEAPAATTGQELVNGSGSRADGADQAVAEDEADGPTKDNDRLDTTKPGLFKSPVIIVALTASNLQVDRHEALAAGCNDFLTKPVNFVWFERKVKEWGCMQALIDFDGWRMWKDFAAAANNNSKATDSKSGAATAKKGGSGGGAMKGAAALRALQDSGRDSTPDHSSG